MEIGAGGAAVIGGQFSVAVGLPLEAVYEHFVRKPEAELGRVLDFAGVETDANSRRAAVAGVRAASVSKGRAELDEDATRRLERLWGMRWGGLGMGEGVR